jgi:hypothetical protein
MRKILRLGAALLILAFPALAQTTAVYDPASATVRVNAGLNAGSIRRIYVLNGDELAKSATWWSTDSTTPVITVNVRGIRVSANFPVQLNILVDDGKPHFVTIPIDFSASVSRIQAPPTRIPAQPVPAPAAPRISSLSTFLVATPSKDDAEYYFSGSVTSAVKSKPNWVADVKIEPLFFFNKVSFAIGPFATIAYDSKSDSSDSLRTGIVMKWGLDYKSHKPAALKTGIKSLADAEAVREYDLLADKTQPKTAGYRRFQRNAINVRFFDYVGAALYEADWKFKVRNLITSQQLEYHAHFGEESDKDKTVFTPMIGGEFGTNFKNPIDTSHHGIARLKAGASFEFARDTPFPSLGFIHKLSSTTDFVERWFMHDEFAFDKDDKGTPVFRAFGRRPRAHFDTDLGINLNDYFTPTVSYEWGEVPPLYKLVRHKLTFKLAYSFTRVTRSVE